jgi:uroporphyrinogen decarboxylase
MNPRERYLATLLFARPDHVPLAPGAPRESTLRAWHSQGLPEGQPYQDALSALLGVPRIAFDTLARLPEAFKMIPTFEERVLEHRDRHYIVQDWMGAITEISDEFDYTYIRSARDFVTRKWHKFPVQSRADWENMAWRYNPADPLRFPPGFWEGCAAAEASGRAVAVSINGPFWQMREWVGMENLCLMMVEQPDFVLEMAAFWQRFTVATLETMLRRVRLDALMLSEDMAYKAHSMISPAMARRFLQPTYLAWQELVRAYDVPLYDMDSDGDIGELIPVWIEAGMNCCNPMEVAAGNDLPALRRRFGRRMAYHGGVDKRAIAAGGEVMRAEVLRVVAPLLGEGGYLPSCDHGVPPDISWPHFVEYARLLAELEGWV